MSKPEQEKTSIKQKIKFFSDSMFRNYQVMRKRWEISNSEKKRSVEIARLGNMAFRLYQTNELSPEKISAQVKKIEKLVEEIKHLEETLRDIIMRADEPRQLSAGDAAAKPGQKSPESAAKPDVKPSGKEPGKSTTKTTDKSPQKPTAKSPEQKTSQSPAVKAPAKTGKATKERGSETKNTKTVDKTTPESIEKKPARKSASSTQTKKPAAKAPAKRKTPAKKTAQTKKAEADK